MGHFEDDEDDSVHKTPHKMKMHWQNRLKNRYWFNSRSSVELDIKR